MFASNSPQAVVKTVAVIGAGKAGRTFSLACAAAGFDVVLEDVMPANLRRAQAEFSDLLEGEAGVSFLAKPLDLKSLAERVKARIAGS